MAVKTTAKVIVDTPVAEKQSFPVPMKNTKRQSFFYGMIVADIFGYRNVENDANMLSLAAKISEETGRTDGSFTSAYAERVSYTRKMYFDFSEDTPQEYKNMETWWDMVNSGVDPSECYVWYVSNIPNFLTNMYAEAVDSAHTIWKPAAQQTMRLEEEAKKDPN